MYKLALFIGRFQPFHNGHLYSLNKCLELAEKVVVVIAKTEEAGTENNPWNYAERERMVQAVIREMGWGTRVERVLGLPDNKSDEVWLKDTVLKAGIKERGGVVVVSNNEWTLRVFRDAGYSVAESGLFNRDELEGVKIRELMRANDTSWKLRVPKVVVSEIDMSVVKKSDTFGE